MARFARPLAWILGIGLLAAAGIGTGCSAKGAAMGGDGGSSGSGGSGGSGGGSGKGGNSNTGGSGGSGGAAGKGSGGSGNGGAASGGASSGGSGGHGSGGDAVGGAGSGGSGGSAGSAGDVGGTGTAGFGGSTPGGGAGGSSGTSTLVSCETTKPAGVVKASAVAISNFTPPDSSGTLAPAGVDSFGSFGTASWPYTGPVGNTYVYPELVRSAAELGRVDHLGNRGHLVRRGTDLLVPRRCLGIQRGAVRHQWRRRF